MFVITADQIGSRSGPDRSADMQDRLQRAHGAHLELAVDQTAGDELQALTADADTALGLVLDLARDGHWSVGLGIGGIRTPLPDAVRKATGPAFIAARDAVDAAKRSEGRFALRVGNPADRPGSAPEAEPLARPTAGAGGRPPARPAEHVEALVRLLLLVRARRTEPGWEIVDLVSGGTSQKDAARALGISDAAVSQRLKSAVWSVDEQARPALVGLLRELDDAT